MRPLGGQLVAQQGIKAGQTAVIGGQTVRFATATPSMMAGGSQVRPVAFFYIIKRNLRWCRIPKLTENTGLLALDFCNQRMY